ncbi:hypothetical protein QQX98_005058 [Neonectria punicea]|uniref:CHAD domain-containing protein n=1 Tax=Neonectria punicea TaxID=979145 RepID=A0ABR1H768_9HYPO
MQKRAKRMTRIVARLQSMKDNDLGSKTNAMVDRALALAKKHGENSEGDLEPLGLSYKAFKKLRRTQKQLCRSEHKRRRSQNKLRRIQKRLRRIQTRLDGSSTELDEIKFSMDIGDWTSHLFHVVKKKDGTAQDAIRQSLTKDLIAADPTLD